MFNRGISEDVVKALRGWSHWEEIIKDPDLFVAIRDKYINIYSQGCSIFKISHKNGQLVPETHYKYLVSPSAKNPYVLWKGDHPALEDRVNEILIQTLDLDLLKRSSRRYAEAEKVGLQQILKSNKNVVDVEIALSPESEVEADSEDRAIEGKQAADRIDFAAIQEKDGKPRIVFFEAKRFANRELRSRKPEPPVVGQIRKYESFIQKHRSKMEASYRRVCENLIELGLPGRYDTRVEEVAASPERLTVDPQVRLVVFDFDKDQRTGNVWKGHREKLFHYLNDRLLLKGTASEFTSGISA
jgi:hypothetical protein